MRYNELINCYLMCQIQKILKIFHVIILIKIIIATTSGISTAHWQKSRKNLVSKIQLSDIDITFRQYLNLNVIDIEDDPIQYWDRNRHCFPRLVEIAIKYLLIVATSVPCERIFSCAGNIMDQNRNRTKPERLSKLLFLNSLPFCDWHLNE